MIGASHRLLTPGVPLRTMSVRPCEEWSRQHGSGTSRMGGQVSGDRGRAVSCSGSPAWSARGYIGDSCPRHLDCGRGATLPALR